MTRVSNTPMYCPEYGKCYSNIVHSALRNTGKVGLSNLHGPRCSWTRPRSETASTWVPWPLQLVLNDAACWKAWKCLQYSPSQEISYNNAHSNKKWCFLPGRQLAVSYIMRTATHWSSEPVTVWRLYTTKGSPIVINNVSLEYGVIARNYSTVRPLL